MIMARLIPGEVTVHDLDRHRTQCGGILDGLIYGHVYRQVIECWRHLVSEQELVLREAIVTPRYLSIDVRGAQCS
jgi:hypothetical protein